MIGKRWLGLWAPPLFPPSVDPQGLGSKGCSPGILVPLCTDVVFRPSILLSMHWTRDPSIHADLPKPTVTQMGKPMLLCAQASFLAAVLRRPRPSGRGLLIPLANPHGTPAASHRCGHPVALDEHIGGQSTREGHYTYMVQLYVSAES